MIFILKMPQLGTMDIGNRLEWFFYTLLPNFCFTKALQDVFDNYQYAKVCEAIGEKSDRNLFCQMVEKQNKINFCCPSKLVQRHSFV